MVRNLKIGQKIQTRRKQLKITQEELAELSNSSTTFVSQLETGYRENITINKLSDIADALGLTLTSLINYQIDDKVAIRSELSAIENPNYLPNTVKLTNKLLQMNRKRAEEVSAAILKLLN